MLAKFFQPLTYMIKLVDIQLVFFEFLLDWQNVTFAVLRRVWLKSPSLEPGTFWAVITSDVLSH